jgi:pseudouridine-5'-phosphate glycosidase/pseudouridine kinase
MKTKIHLQGKIFREQDKRRTLIDSNINRSREQISAMVIPSQDSIHQITTQRGYKTRDHISFSSSTSISPEVIVAGALAVDYSCDFRPLAESHENTSPVLHTSNPAAISQSLGGVGHNVALAAHLLGRRVSLCSLVGDDLPGKTAIQHVNSQGMDASHIYIDGKAGESRTAQYVAVNDTKKDLVLAMADMGILEAVSPVVQQEWREFIHRSKAKWFIADANLVPNTLIELFKSAKSSQIRTAFEPVSTAKAARIFNSGPNNALQVYPNHLIDLATPNSLELSSMHSTARSSGLLDRNDWWAVVDALGIPSSGIRQRLVQLTSAELVNKGIPQQCIQLLPFIPTIITKLGPKGVILTMLLGKEDKRLRNMERDNFILSRSTLEDPSSPVGGVYMRWFSSTEIPENKIVSVNGVGDTFLGALVSEILESEENIEDAVDLAQRAAVMTLCSSETVNPDLRSLVQNTRQLSHRN